MQHSIVYALAHRRPDAGPLGKPNSCTERITIFRRLSSSFANSLSRTHLRSPLAGPHVEPHAGPHASPHPVPQRLSFSCPHIGTEQQRPHAITVSSAVGYSIGCAKQPVADAFTQPTSDIGSVNLTNLAPDIVGIGSGSEHCALTHAEPRAVCVAVILTVAASFGRRCLQLTSAESVTDSRSVEVSDARSVEVAQLTSDIGLHHILTITEPIGCAEPQQINSGPGTQ